MDRRRFLILLGGCGLGGLAALDALARASSSGSVASAAKPTLVRSRVLSGAIASPSIQPAAAAARDDRIAAENARRGDRGWDPSGAPAESQVAGFATAASIASGRPIDLRYGSTVGLDVSVHRLGWYGGSGGRLVYSQHDVPAAGPIAPDVDPATGRAEASGGATLTIPTDRDWLPGAYVATLRPVDGSAPRWVPLSVRPADGAGPAPILFVSATATWQAYNRWGGADLYTGSVGDDEHEGGGRRATQVSFDRPQADTWGLGLMSRWELNFIRWMERLGYPVDYCADVDLELHPQVATKRRLILFVGHHEYWSRPMRTTIETAIGTGTNVAFLSANEIYWQTRLEESPLGPGRRITCHKAARDDPLAASQPELTTCRWREPPVNDPEAPLVGQMYAGIVKQVADWVVAGSGHWLYEGTGLRDGDRIRNLVGPEFDTFYPALGHPGTTILAKSPVETSPKGPAYVPVAPTDARLQTATCYEAESGATVLAAGTYQWSWAIDGYGARTYRGAHTPLDPRVERMSRNLLDRLG